MDCLEPPLLEVPQGNWYCDDCFDSSDESEDDDDPEEVDDLNNDIEEVIGDLPESRLRVRQQQPQILRTLQSERIRNAILARMSLRSARESFGEGPSTSAPVAARPKAVRKRRKRKARRRARRVVVEYDVDGSDKFAMKTRRVKRRKVGKKRRKVVKAAKRKSASAAPSTGFKNVNANVYELQRGRAMAGLSNFNIFQPTNQLDYVPDDDGLVDDSGIDETAENSSGSVLTQAIISLSNPLRRNLIIKSRVLQNCTTTSSEPNLLDSIMQDQEMFGPGSIRKKFAVEKSSGKLLFVGKNADGAKQAAGGDGSKESKPAEAPASKPSTGNDPSTVPNDDGTSSNQLEANRSSDDRDESQNHPIEHLEAPVDNKPKNKPKKPAFDMFDENSAPEEIDDCPNFSIYDSVDALVEQETSQHRPNVYDEENVDLVQMSDGEHPNESPPAIVASQPASPDLENDKVGEMLPERSYTPPLMQKTSDDGPEKDENERKKKEKESKRKRELERYNVRDRLKDRSPPKVKDKFGRNRSRSRSNSRKRQQRKRSNSRRSKDRNYRSRSRSRRRTPSIEYDRKKKAGYKDKPKRSNRRTRSRSPRNHRPMTPDRRARSRSKKAKRKKHREYSKEKPSTLTKEVFTSGPNILVSVNFNNQEEKSTKRSRSRDREEPKDIVDITARKKITISSKPVAIIDLARSPFRELTPEYQSNVIELSDSETEKTSEKRTPKSPDSSSKLYDPFDILNSPPNENVTSSQNTAAMALQKLPEKKLPEPAKGTFTYNKNIMALAASGSLFFNEENLVSSSSSLIPLEKLLPLPLVSKAENEKPEVVPMDIAESPYSPGHEYDDSFQDQGDNAVLNRQAKGGNKGANIFDELFGSSTPPGLDKAKGSSGKKGELMERFLRIFFKENPFRSASGQVGGPIKQIFDEDEASGAGDRGGEAGDQTLLLEADYHEGAVQGNSEKSGSEGEMKVLTS